MAFDRIHREGVCADRSTYIIHGTAEYIAYWTGVIIRIISIIRIQMFERYNIVGVPRIVRELSQVTY
jgi:hypothetical protein